MKILYPTTVDETTLTTSNVPETVQEHAVGAYYLAGELVRVASTHSEYEALQGDTPATVTITIATPGVVTHTAHGMADNDPVEITTTGALPTGLTAGVTYYVSDPTADTYKLSATSGGAEITTSGSQSGTHTAHGNPNRGRDPTLEANAAYWLETGSTNRWRMFDAYLESITERTDTIETTITPTERVNGLAMFNLDARSVNVTVDDTLEGEVYNEDFNLISTANVFGWHSWFFAPIIRATDLLVEGLPNYLGAAVTTVIDNTGETAGCGLLVAGSIRQFGETVYGAGFGIIDSSRKETDDLGRTTIIERSYRRTATFRVMVEKALVDEVARVLASRRAVPSVFIGTGEYASTMIYGFPRDWWVAIEYPNHSVLEIELEGLA